jgi:hypothetical protein
MAVAPHFGDDVGFLNGDDTDHRYSNLYRIGTESTWDVHRPLKLDIQHGKELNPWCFTDSTKQYIKMKIPHPNDKDNDYFVLFDADQFETIRTRSWHMLLNPDGYSWSAIGGSDHLLMHRLITKAPRDKVVDHLNGTNIGKYILDNRSTNLRVVTQSENSNNMRMNSNNTSGFTGVNLHKPTGRWEARGAFQGKRMQQFFKTKEAAIEHRKAFNEETGSTNGKRPKLSEEILQNNQSDL